MKKLISIVIGAALMLAMAGCGEARPTLYANLFDISTDGEWLLQAHYGFITDEYVNVNKIEWAYDEKAQVIAILRQFQLMDEEPEPLVGIPPILYITNESGTYTVRVDEVYSTVTDPSGNTYFYTSGEGDIWYLYSLLYGPGPGCVLEYPERNS